MAHLPRASNTNLWGSHATLLPHPLYLTVPQEPTGLSPADDYILAQQPHSTYKLLDNSHTRSPWPMPHKAVPSEAISAESRT